MTDASFVPGTFSEWTAWASLGGAGLLALNWVTGAGVVCRWAQGVIITELALGPGSFGNWTHCVGFADGGVFFYSALSGASATGYRSDDGSITTLGQTAAGSFSSWTHWVGLGDDRMFAYNMDTGAGAVCHRGNDGSISTSTTMGAGSFSTWTHWISLGDGYLLAYNSGNGSAAVCLCDDADRIETLNAIAAGTFGVWTHLVGLSTGALLAYNSNTGAAATAYKDAGNNIITRLSIPAHSLGAWTHVTWFAPLQFSSFTDQSGFAVLSSWRELSAKGFQFIALSVYGDPGQQSYAGTMLRRFPTTPQDVKLDLTEPEYQAARQNASLQSFFPAIIAATGTKENPLFGVVFEPGPAVSPPLSFQQADSNALHAIQFNPPNAMILRWAAIYGSETDRAYAGVYWPNPNAVVWAVLEDTDSPTTQQNTLAMMTTVARVALQARSPDGRYLSIYRDDGVGLWSYGIERTDAEYVGDFGAFTDAGSFPLVVQAGGHKQIDTRFAYVFAQQQNRTLRQWSMTGSPVAGLEGMDELIQLGMRKCGARAASLAVAQYGEVIFSRGYRWAEAEYPLGVEPDTIFRIASCSKVITAIGIWQLLEGNVEGQKNPLTLTDLFLDVLGKNDYAFNPPPGKSFNPYVNQITVGDLLNFSAGLPGQSSANASATDPPDNFATGQQDWGTFPMTKQQLLASFLCEAPLSQPGAPSGYSNPSYILLGIIIEAVTGMPYEQFVRANVLARALSSGANPPTANVVTRVGGSLFSDRLPGEAIYQTAGTLAVGKSLMTADQPNVAWAYGAQFDLSHIDSAGGLVSSAPELVRLMAALENSSNSVFRESTTLDQFLSCQVWDGLPNGDNATTATGAAVTTNLKGGDLSSLNSVLMRRSDGISVAFLLACDVWPGTPDMSLSGTPGTWAYFQLNERINAWLAAYPSGRGGRR